ncbi:hypothetical protein [Nocardioides sp.]|uniref:hypothetical protein n=1 Tax=Nocardioides sp. TaxID=35761 RepID=UPI003219F515
MKGLEFGIGAWNAHNAAGATINRYVAERIHAGNVAIVLTEVWRRHDALHRITARHGLTLLTEAPKDRTQFVVPEEGSTAVLLSPAFRLRDWEVVPMKRLWEVHDYDRPHEPRRPIRVVGDVEGQRAELLAVHGPTAGNGPAVEEFKSEVARILTTTRDDTVSAAVGDFNFRLREARAWARQHGLKVAGTGPDLAAVHGARVQSRRGARRTSDHYDVEHLVKVRR